MHLLHIYITSCVASFPGLPQLFFRLLQALKAGDKAGDEANFMYTSGDETNGNGFFCIDRCICLTVCVCVCV